MLPFVSFFSARLWLAGVRCALFLAVFLAPTAENSTAAGFIWRAKLSLMRSECPEPNRCRTCGCRTCGRFVCDALEFRTGGRRCHARPVVNLRIGTTAGEYWKRQLEIVSRRCIASSAVKHQFEVIARLTRPGDPVFQRRQRLNREASGIPDAPLEAGHDSGGDVTQHSRGAISPELCQVHVPPKSEGAGNAGCRPHPWPACNKKSRRQSPQVQPEHPGIPRTMG